MSQSATLHAGLQGLLRLPMPGRLTALVPICLASWLCSMDMAIGQDIEPRRWTPLPVGVNIVGLGYVYTFGDLLFDPVLRIEDAEFQLHTGVVSYNRYFGLLGTTARIDAQLPVQSGRWKGLVDGVKQSVVRDGLADPRLRLSVNLLGAPAMDVEEFQEYHEKHATHTIVGAALAMRFPLGEYKKSKLINLGENRFRIRPQLGVLHTRGPWSFELTGSAFFFTENDEFFGDNRLEQDPLFAVQAHVVRAFEPFWISADVAYGWAGESEINGEHVDDDKSNLLYGVSCGMRIGKIQSVRVGYIRRETFVDTGSDNNNFLVSWSLLF